MREADRRRDRVPGSGTEGLPVGLFNGGEIGRPVSGSPAVGSVNRMFTGVSGKVPLWASPAVHTSTGIKAIGTCLGRLGAAQGMSRKANCQDNASAESFFGHLKGGFFYREDFKAAGGSIAKLDGYIDWYNNDRIRCGLGGMSPVEYRQYHEAMG